MRVSLALTVRITLLSCLSTSLEHEDYLLQLYHIIYTVPLMTCFQGLALWIVVAGGEEPETSGHIRQYHLQDSQGGYRFGYKTADQMAEVEGGPNSEVKGKYAYVDENGDMRGVEYTAGVNGYSPKILNKEDAGLFNF